MKTFLIVDDSPVARSFVRRCLEIIGFDDATFFEAGHGRDALDLLGSEEVELVVTDLNMPVMDGAELARRIRANPRIGHIPVVVVSSLVNEAQERELREAGVLAVVAKPISPQVLAESLGELGKGGDE